MGTTDRIRKTVSSSANHTSKTMRERTIPVIAWEAQALCNVADAAHELMEREPRHDIHPDQHYCTTCDEGWPCATERVIDALADLDLQ